MHTDDTSLLYGGETLTENLVNAPVESSGEEPGQVKVKAKWYEDSDCEAQFSVMVHEWRHIKLGQRAGQGHDPSGLAGTKNGSTAVLCRACLHPDINLPDDWKQAPLSRRWLYALLLSMDANFRQKARIRPNDKNDPALAGGWGTFVPNKPYLEEVRKHADQDKASPQSGTLIRRSPRAYERQVSEQCFARVMDSFVQMEWSMVPDTLDRYINMDCILLMSLIGCPLPILFVTYNIACQWSINFYERMNQLPISWQFPPDRSVTFKVLKFHLLAHIEKCHAPYALEYMEGVGDVDREAPERSWSGFNNNARSFSMMTAGACLDTGDDHCNHTNFEKTIKLAKYLLKKLIRGVSNLVVYTRSFSAFTEALKDQHASDMKLWEKHVTEWEKGTGKDCPYDMPVSSITMAKVKRALTEEEKEQEKMHGNDSALMLSELLIEGLGIEETQRSIRIMASQSDLMLYQETDLQNQWTSLFKRIQRFCESQLSHMLIIKKSLDKLPSDVEVETIQLLLPSSLDHIT
uniref:CxC2-like cysteine cluster KDZ transposase-associated domain-containing protein n=1 Tax=Moniliophthora roreri TaxID=221103 RepID=A0A0W0EZV3_MONRR